MRNKTKIILTLACASLCCLALGACKRETELDKLDKEKETRITVTYDANGGRFMERAGISIVYKFNPDFFTDGDGDGKIEIPLNETDPAVAHDSQNQRIGVPGKSGYSFAGWFKTREPVVNEQNEPLDAYGNVLEIKNDAYYIKGTDTITEQAYTYSDRWEFDEDKVVYELGSKDYSLTLYAAWVPYYRFNFYYEHEKTGEWTLLTNQTFDYTTTQRFRDSDYGYDYAVKTTVNSDYIWTPQWSGANQTGAMEHDHKRTDTSTYSFPKRTGYTFQAAYSDEACTQEIDTELLHAGTLTYNEESKKLVPEGVTQNVYVKFDKGEQYRIASARDFVTYAKSVNQHSVYTILANELDFSGETWPSTLTCSEFSGKIVGNNCTFKNISAKNGDPGAVYGGLFGTVAAKASIKDITFDNVLYDMDTGTTARGIGSADYGVFAGVIEAGAEVSGIVFRNFTLQMGNLEPGTRTYQINLICGNANGNKGLTYSGAQIVLKGVKDNREEGKYLYFVKNVVVNEANGNVTYDYEMSSSKADKRNTETYVAYPAGN